MHLAGLELNSAKLLGSAPQPGADGSEPLRQWWLRSVDTRSQTCDLQREYALRFGRNAEYRRSVWEILVRVFFQRWIPVDGSVLDVGSGWGEFINQVTAQRKYAIDLNPDAGDKVARDVTLFAQDCSNTWPLRDGTLDVVFTSNFFEHLPTKDALIATLREARRCLKPGGRIICLGPNVKYLAGRYWDFWDHYLPLTERSLQEALKLAGFSVDSATARFLPYTMSQKSRPPLFLLRVYLKLPLLWPIFGRQFLLIGRKENAGIRLSEAA